MGGLMTVATPAAAQLPSAGISVGIELGKRIGTPSSRSATISTYPADYIGGGGANETVTDGFRLSGRGEHVGLLVGAELGPLRLELDAMRRLLASGATPSDRLVERFNDQLDRPLATTPPGATSLPPLTAAELRAAGNYRLDTLGANILVRQSLIPLVSVYAGVGAGLARYRGPAGSDNKLALQAIAGARASLGTGMGIGLRYRYLHTGRFATDPILVGPYRSSSVSFCDAFACGLGQNDGKISGQVGGRIKAHSLGLVLDYRFGT